jgi:hypothetical protein
LLGYIAVQSRAFVKAMSAGLAEHLEFSDGAHNREKEPSLTLQTM